MSAEAVAKDAEISHEAPGDWSAYVLLLTSLIAMGFASEQWLLIAPFLIGVGLHPVLAPRVKLRLGYLTYLLLALPFAILSNMYEVEGRSGLDFNTPFYITLYLQMFAILRLYRPLPDKDRLPIVLVCTGMAMAGTGPDAPGHGLFIALVSVYAMGLLFLLRAHMRTRRRTHSGQRLCRAAIGAAFILSVYGTVVGVLLIRQHFNEINNALLRLMMKSPLGSAAGFGDMAQLGDIAKLRNDINGQRVAIRALGKKGPGYLRGNIFVKYGRARWNKAAGGVEHNLRAAVAARGADQEPNKDRKVLRYTLAGRPAPEAFQPAELWIYPASLYQAHFFLPLQTTALDTVSDLVYRLPGNIMKSKFRSTSRGYGVLDDPAPVFDPPAVDNYGMPVGNQTEVSPAYLDVPPGAPMREALDKVLHKAQKDMPFDVEHDGPAAAVRSIAHYFQTKYTYRIGIKFTYDDPLVEFLAVKRHGHCELFASAGTLLLRRVGVPARYVTGFVCKEKNPYTDLWIARNRHAHAWVEYFDAKTGWQTAEFTPDNGLPQFQPVSGVEAFLEYLGALWEQATGFLMREGFSGLFTLLGQLGYWLIDTWPRRIGVALFIGLFFAWRLWKRRARRRRPVRAPREFPADLAAQRLAFLQLEKDLRRKGLGKEAAETLEEYAQRLTQEEVPDRDRVVDFIHRFAAQRYAPFA